MLKEYPEYKGSIALWDKKYPSHWKDFRGKTLFNNTKVINKNNEWNNVLSLTLRGVVNNDIDNPLGLVPKDYNTYQLFKKDDLVFKLIDLQNISTSRVGLVHEDGIMSPAYIRLELKNEKKDDVNIRFVYLYYYSLWLRAICNSLCDGVRQTLAAPDLLNLTIPIPPISEQNAIVKYLDYKTKQIDEFVSAKENEIESLQELKKSLVADAVTKGISGEELVDSGIEWLPKVPKGWAVHTLRHLLKAFSEKNHSEMQLLSVTRELGVIVRDVEDTESNHNFIPDDLSNYKMVKKGQFVINKMKAWQGSYGVSDFDGIVSPAYFIFDLDFENKEFFHLAIRSRKYADFFARYSDGIRIGQWDLSMLDMKNIPFFVPPIEEQEKIVKYCKDKVRNIDTLITSIQKQVTLVKELRAKIIADVVTGKIDVREAV